MAVALVPARTRRAAYRRTREAVALVIVHFVESLGGIRAVQAFRREPRNQEIFEDVNDRLPRAPTCARSGSSRVYGPGIKLIGNVTIAVVLLVRRLPGRSTARSSVGVLAAFLLYLRRFFEPMQELSQFYNSFQSATAALEKLSGVLEEEPAVPEPARPVGRCRAARGRGRASTASRFGYRRRHRPVLPALDLHVPAGQTVALVGATGAGKTTIARLVARFYDPVDRRGPARRRRPARPVRRRPAPGRRHGDPGELPVLRHGRRQHRASAGPARPAPRSRRRPRRSAPTSSSRALPDGYDTDVRKRGGRLSAGQRQLVAFARAFLADPAVLILDEATSSLDIPRERLVQRALRTILADRTALIIAHRLSTVEIADRVLVARRRPHRRGRLARATCIAGTGRYAAPPPSLARLARLTRPPAPQPPTP